MDRGKGASPLPARPPLTRLGSFEKCKHVLKTVQSARRLSSGCKGTRSLAAANGDIFVSDRERAAVGQLLRRKSTDQEVIWDLTAERGPCSVVSRTLGRLWSEGTLTRAVEDSAAFFYVFTCPYQLGFHSSVSFDTLYAVSYFFDGLMVLTTLSKLVRSALLTALAVPPECPRQSP